MSPSSGKTEVYLESGRKKTFAGSIHWPGWCRSAGSEEAALQALWDYGERYAAILKIAQIPFQIPAGPSDFVIVERLVGDASTDFGAPGKSPTSDSAPMDEIEIQRYQGIVKACWKTLAGVVASAEGKELTKGPRGGGRSQDDIVQHVLNAEAAYLRRIAGRLELNPESNLYQKMDQACQSALDSLAAAVHNGLPAVGPRGGKNWTARYYTRRAAWHIVDHAWEIEDRIP